MAKLATVKAVKAATAAAKQTKKGNQVVKAKPKAKAKAKHTKPTTVSQLKAKAKAEEETETGKSELKEKIAILVAECSEKNMTPQEVLAKIKGKLSKLESSKVWGMHNTACKNSKEVAEQAAAVDGKKDKGNLALAWYIDKKAGGNVYSQLTVSSSAEQRLTKTETWKPRKYWVDQFGQEEFDQHVASGRLIWRECRRTRGIYEYQDTEDFTIHKSAKKLKELTTVEDKESDELEDILGRDLFLSIQDDKVWAMEDGKKGAGKGSKDGKGEGKGGKGAAAKAVLAIKDGIHEESSDDEGDKEGVDKLRKMKNLMQSQLESFNENMMRLEKSKNKFWSKAAKVSSEAQAAKVQKTLAKLRKLIVSEKPLASSTIKAELLHCAQMYKDMKSELQTIIKLQEKDKEKDKEKDQEKEEEKKPKKQKT